MKKILSLLLCVIMITSILAGCGTKDENDKGAIIPVYLSSPISNFDPAYALHDDAGVKMLGMIYEGLTRINDKGKVEKALAKSWTITENAAEEYYMLQFELNTTAWSDGRQVSADDVVFAWKRLLEPEFSSEAAAMLYDIKNARNVKAGEMTIDDLGLYAVDITTLQVEFETSVDYDLFLEYCASLALVPLREDKVKSLENWGSNPSTIVSNGPFFLKSYKEGISMELERSVYYYRNIDKEDSLFKYVTPHRFVVDFSKDAEGQLASFNDGKIFLLNDIPLSQRAANAGNAEVKDMPTAHTYVFNTKKAPFDNENVRKALSMAIDRNAVADIVKFAKASTGIITDGVFEDSKGTSFRANGGQLISPTGDVAGAKSLLGSASGSFKITIRPNDVDRAVADYVVGVWSQLGFNVTVEELKTEYYMENEYDQWRDLFEVAYRASDFDVIAIDMNMLSTDAFSTLAMFSKPFSGGAIDIVGGNFDFVPHISGYSNDAYDSLFEDIFAEKSRAARVSKLHDAEKMIVDAMPIMPIFEYQDAYLISGELSGVKMTHFGYKIFNKTKLKDYLQYQTTTTAGAVSGEETTAAAE
jgi:ABC-type oligopeptide transport system, periplasmic component